MPLNRTLFFGGDEVRDAILRVLRSASVAYTADEIVQEVSFIDVTATLDEVTRVLADLRSRGLVVTRTVGSDVYFTFDDRFGFRPPLR